MNRILKLFRAALSSARQQRARRSALEQLDAHTLRDIGLEHEAERARRRSTRERLQFGIYY
jgi:uncharacterized protein YjiS (DUF1127 family)